jgi:hypothetical protein
VLLVVCEETDGIGEKEAGDIGGDGGIASILYVVRRLGAEEEGDRGGFSVV